MKQRHYFCNPMKKSIFITLALFIAEGLFAQRTQIREFYIGDAKTACIYNNAITSCLKIKFHADSNWKEFPYNIKGFIHEQGIECRVVVEETALEFPDEDSMMFAYRLIKIVGQRKTVLEDIALLTNNRWRVNILEKDLKVTPARKAGAYIEFNTDSNRISGFAGCNSFTGNILADNGVIQFGEIQNTLISCANDPVEAMIMEGLKGKAAFYVRNNTLFLVCENLLTIHLRPEKRLDSIISLINQPIRQKPGSAFKILKADHFSVVVDYLDGSPVQNMVFGVDKTTAEESKTILYKLHNLNLNDDVQTVYILKKPHELPGMYYATLVMKDGSRKTVVMRNDI